MEIPNRNMPLYPSTHLTVYFKVMCAVSAAGNWTKLIAKKDFSLLPPISLLSIPASFTEELATPWTGADKPWRAMFFSATQHHHGTNLHVNPFMLLFICKPRMAYAKHQSQLSVLCKLGKLLDSSSVHLAHLNLVSFQHCLSQGNWGSLRALIRNIIFDS